MHYIIIIMFTDAQLKNSRFYIRFDVYIFYVALEYTYCINQLETNIFLLDELLHIQLQGIKVIYCLNKI